MENCNIKEPAPKLNDYEYLLEAVLSSEDFASLANLLINFKKYSNFILLARFALPEIMNPLCVTLNER